MSGNPIAAPRVLIAVTSALTAGAFVPPIARAFVQAGCPVWVTSSPGGGLAGLDSLFGVRAVPAALSRDMNPFSSAKSLASMIRIIKEARPDVVICATPKASIVAALAARICRTRLIVHLAWGLRSESMQGPSRLVVQAMEQLTVGLAHEVIANSHSLRRRLMEQTLFGRSKVVVLGLGSSHGVDLDAFSYAPRREKVDEPMIGFVGRIRRDKGVAELLAATRRMHEKGLKFRLVLAGDVEDDTLLPVIAEHPITEWRPFTDDVPSLMQEIDVLALPSWREGFPNVVLEASATGRPVVTSDATGAVDSVCDGLTGRVVPVGDEDALEAALTELVEDADQRAQFGLLGRQFVTEHYSQESVCGALVRHIVMQHSGVS